MTRLRLTLADVALMVLITVCIALLLALLGEPPRPASIVNLAGARYGEGSTLVPAAGPGLSPATVSPRSGGVVAEPSGRKTPRGHTDTALIGGWISQAAPSYGSWYLAVRAPRGTLVRVCAARCVTLRSTDYGPSSRIRPRRIADLALVQWLAVCGLPREAGLCRGTIELLGKPRPVPTAPATDTSR